MSQSYPDQFNNKPLHARIRDKAEVLQPGDDDDARLATNGSSKPDPLTSYVNAAQNDHSYVHEWLQRNYSNSSPTTTSASPQTVVEANEQDHDVGITGHSHPSSRIRPGSGRVERILAPIQKGSALRSRSRETGLTSPSLEYLVGRQPPVQPVEAASLETSTGTSFLESEQYANDQDLRPHRPRSPSPERTGTLSADEEENGLEPESMGCIPMLDSYVQGVDVDQGYHSASRPQSHSSVRQSANEEDLVESLLESLAVAAVRSFEGKNNALGRTRDDTSINVVLATSPLLSEDAASPPPMAPMPPPPPLPPLRTPGVPPADFFPVQPAMPTAFNIARSLAGARYLRHLSEPSSYVAFESKATQADEIALPRNRTRYKDSSTQTYEVDEIEKQSPHPSGQSLNSISSTASKGTQTSGPSPPVPSPPASTQRGSSPRPSHLHKQFLHRSQRADGEPPANLSDMRRSILTAKSQPWAKRPPANATSTKLSRILVNSEALTLMGVPHEVHDEYVVVHRILSRQEILQLAELTVDIREARSKGVVESGERLWNQWSTDRYSIPWHRDDR
ncbi:hypothetical protein DV736_g6534, partial [Chaetothyriales sp. CBS 134916]